MCDLIGPAPAWKRLHNTLCTIVCSFVCCAFCLCKCFKSVYLWVCLSVRLYICLSVYVSVYVCLCVVDLLLTQWLYQSINPGIHTTRTLLPVKLDHWTTPTLERGATIKCGDFIPWLALSRPNLLHIIIEARFYWNLYMPSLYYPVFTA